MFSYDQNDFYCDQVPLDAIARAAGTPCYVYSAKSILDAYHAYTGAFNGLDHTICFAVKANSTLGVLSLLAKAGAGFDIVSGGELFRVLKAGGDPSRVVFSGVGKTAAEIEYALTSGIHSFNCESEAELALIDALAARLGKRAGFALRVNPDVDAATHPYISTGLKDHKFGIDIADAEAIYARARQFTHVEARGVSCHIGSQMLDLDPMLEAAGKVVALLETLRGQGHNITDLDLGGGLGVAYRPGDQPSAIADFAARLRPLLERASARLMLEPGRSIVGPAGVLLTRVLYRKQSPKKEFVIVDAAMNDLIRPTLYHAHHEILPLRKNGYPEIHADIVGPVCESGDYLAKGRNLPAVLPGDFLAVCTAGAYGFVQASNYNSRPRPAEVLVEGGTWRVIRERETLEDLIRGEKV
jgi:diaminopimelate decarboxylase